MTLEEQGSAYLKSLHLLYVEDDPDTREQMALLLARWVGKVVIATDGAEGLAAFRAQPAQVVITDIWMPRMDGLVMSQEIRKLDPDVFIIVTTCFDDRDSLTRSIATEVDQYVLKPIKRTQLEFALLSSARRQRNLAPVRTAANALDADAVSRLDRLTAREREVLARIGRGHSSREIGLDLGISVKTVQAHQANLMLKLGLHKSTALTALAIRAGIF
jgi:DNA-binding NarL/FixJ family response regulator